jgi:dipeptidyl aminopeptidase/acylaminoacyl peptidase
MSVSAPARPSRSDDSIDREELRALVEALIEEARRRTRRRRRRNAAAALLVAAGIGAGALIFGGSGGPAAVSANEASSGGRSASASVRPLRVRNGPLTVADGNGIIALDRHGARHRLFGCQPPGFDRFCTVIQGIAWSPSGDELLFTPTTVSMPSRFRGMHLLDVATGKTRRAGGEGFSPAWSQDGRIALVEPSIWPLPVGSIYIRRIVGSHVTDELLATGTVGYDSSPSWSPDGKRLVFATRRDGQWTISIIDADGSHRRLLATHATAPTWSPDGTVIAYRTSCGARLISPNGTDVSPQTHRGCGSLGVRGVPHWSPDGRRIAIATRDSIYVMNRDGTGRQFLPLSSFGEPFSPIFGPVAQVSWRPIPK